MKGLHKDNDVEMLILYPCSATIVNTPNDDMLRYIQSMREKLIVVCVDACIYKYIDYCDIALYYRALAPGNADIDIINYNDIITYMLHDQFYEEEQLQETPVTNIINYDSDMSMTQLNYTNIQIYKYLKWNVSDTIHFRYLLESDSKSYSNHRNQIVGKCYGCIQ